MYAYIYVADKYEGLILVGAGTLLDGNPLNNFLERELTFNPHGLLRGASSISFAGTYAYICCDAGLVVVDLDDPKCPQVTAVLGEEELHHPHHVAVQFRYAFVTDEEGVQVLDITDLAHPEKVHSVELPDAHGIYVARTYAYVAAGQHGLVILDVTNPEAAFVDQVYDAHGEINDAEDVQLGITNVSLFAYLADGKNGLRVIQLTSPQVPGNDGFSPRPIPELIATYKLPTSRARHRRQPRHRSRSRGGRKWQPVIGVRPRRRPAAGQERMGKMIRLPDGSPWFTTDNIMDPQFFDIRRDVLRRR